VAGRVSEARPLLEGRARRCRSLSLLIEILQLPFAVRATDIDDLILNTAGCMAGYGIFYAVRGAIRRKNPNM